MWRAIIIAAICISSFFPFTNARYYIEYQCRAGFRIERRRNGSGEACRELNAGEMGCPAATGNNSDGGQCVISQKYCSSTELTGPLDPSILRPRCMEEGFILDPVRDVCIKTVDHGSSCPSGCEANGPNCVSWHNRYNVCWDGAQRPDCLRYKYTIQRGERCSPHYHTMDLECRLTAPLDFHCPVGTWVWEYGGKCKAVCTASRACPNGGVVKGFRCIEEIQMAPERACPLDNQQKTVPERWRCLQGVRSGSNCQNTQIVQNVLVCPTNFRPVANGTGCEAINTVPFEETRHYF